ncbi:MAG TPA: ATP:cob(I)alamin adenosyltransferase, partial [Facklamia tabacinasalis]|nr:ATP:cob(I)alamin adenosyltransferase [Ruoffia tabacinasalis]
EYAPIPPTVESFILPGGTQLAAQLHFARTVTRRAERRIVSLQQEQTINQHVLKFINRLSDYFFALARVANSQAGVEDVLYERSGRVFHTELTKKDIPK